MFTADDITASAPIPRSVFHRFNVERDGVPLGWVNVRTAELLNRSVEPKAHIADRLNDYERDNRFDDLAAGLEAGLSLA